MTGRAHDDGCRGHGEPSTPAEYPPRDGGGPQPGARTLRPMTDHAFKPGDDVFTPQGRGTVIDVRPTPAGKWVFGVEDADGAVGYFTDRALRLAQS